MLEVSREDISTFELQDFPVNQRFIKIPINNYLKILPGYNINPNKLGFNPIPPQIAIINALNNPKYRFVVAALSRRTGKTEISNIIAQLISYIPNSNVLIISPNYSLSQISWDLQRELLKKFNIEVTRSNAKDRVIQLVNGSTIRMASVSQSDSAVGRSYDFIIFDEAALDDRGEEAFNIRLRPTLDKLNSKAIFISTPRGKNWFYELYKRGFDDEFDDWVSIHSDWTENPRANKKDVEKAAKVMSKAELQQEYYADFVALQGQIYNLTDENIIDVNLDHIDTWDVIAGLDMGFRDATAFCVGITDGTNIYIIDEYEKQGSTTKAHAEVIKEKAEKWDIDFIYIDSAAAQTRYDFAMNFDITTTNALKSVADGIGYVASLIENKRLFIDRKCTRVIECLSNVVWDDREGLIKEKPKKSPYLHMADAVRYMVYSHSYNLESL